MEFIISLTSFFASLLTLFSGFGLGTLLMPVVAIFFPISVAIALTALVHLLNNLFKLMHFWGGIHWHTTFVFGIPALFAAILGAWLLSLLGTLPSITTYEFFGHIATITPIKLCIGLLLITFAFIEWSSITKQYNISPRYLPLGGVLSGFFGGLSGHQGAFRSAFLLHTGLDKTQFVATNAAIASIVDITRLTVYGLNVSMLFEKVDPPLVAFASTAAFAGVITGKIFLQKITISSIQRIVAIMLLLLGVFITSGII
jgi:hypothetical protein